MLTLLAILVYGLSDVWADSRRPVRACGFTHWKFPRLSHSGWWKMALEKELETYKQKLPELTANEGKFVLIHGDKVIDVYGTYEDALKEGYTQFKLEPFLVKQIHSVEQIQFISRFVEICKPSLPS